MIRQDKTNNDYVIIDYRDILMGAIKAAEIDEELSNYFMGMFSDNINTKKDKLFDEKAKSVRLLKDSKEVKFLIEKTSVIDYRTLITADILKDALVRSYYEFNHEMKNKLSSYFRKYVDNEINGIDNTILKEEIINDKILLEYIKKYDNFNEYLEDKINKNIDMDEKVKKRR